MALTKKEFQDMAREAEIQVSGALTAQPTGIGDVLQQRYPTILITLGFYLLASFNAFGDTFAIVAYFFSLLLIIAGYILRRSMRHKKIDGTIAEMHGNFNAANSMLNEIASKGASYGDVTAYAHKLRESVEAEMKRRDSFLASYKKTMKFLQIGFIAYAILAIGIFKIGNTKNSNYYYGELYTMNGLEEAREMTVKQQGGAATITCSLHNKLGAWTAEDTDHRTEENFTVHRISGFAPKGASEYEVRFVTDDGTAIPELLPVKIKYSGTDSWSIEDTQEITGRFANPEFHVLQLIRRFRNNGENVQFIITEL